MQIISANGEMVLGPSNMFDENANLISPSVEDVMADFTSSVLVGQNFRVSPGEYHIFSIGIFPENGSPAGFGDDTIVEHDIVVTIPGYTDAEFPNIEQIQPGNTGDPVYSRFYLGQNKFRFTFKQLANDMVRHVFTLSQYVSEAFTALSEHDGIPHPYNTEDILGQHFASSSEYYTGNESLVHCAFGPLPSTMTVLEGQTLSIMCSLDLENMINVYNSGTPEKTDDIVQFAPEFWTRFSFSYTYR